MDPAPSASTATGDDPCLRKRVKGFAVELARTTGGAATPVAAAEVQDGNSTWRLVKSDSNGATVVSESGLRHAITGTDGTWFVDSGHDCG